VRDLHARYLAAGAEVIQTNTFGASRPRLALTGLDAQLVRLNSVAVELARAAGARIVVASLGPTGLDPCAPEAAAEIERAYADQVAALADAGVDGLHFETQYHGVEARAAIRAARRVAPSLPLIVSFTVALGDHGYQTPLGVTLADMADAILDAEPDAVGLNCSLEARKMLGPLRALRARTELPILVQPQAGQPSVGCRGDHRGDSPERFARDALALVFAGADAVGGCCGASPAHIAALATALAEVG
jgi:methionine synthase I (cobalamin-dependent)